MKTNIKVWIDLKPFTVPNYVLVEQSAKPRQDGFSESPKYELKELSESTLDSLCRQFREDIFAKAGKTDPYLEER